MLLLNPNRIGLYIGYSVELFYMPHGILQKIRLDSTNCYFVNTRIVLVQKINTLQYYECLTYLFQK